MTYHWTCLGNHPNTPPCGATGVYEHTAKTGDTGPAWKHTAATGHATSTHLREWAA